MGSVSSHDHGGRICLARDTPHHMDWLSFMVPLQYQHARPFRIGWVVFDYDPFPHAFVNIPNQDTICNELIIAMIRDQNLPPCDQLQDAVKDLAHQKLWTRNLLARRRYV